MPRARAVIVAVVAFVVFNANGREIATYDSQPAKYLAVEIAKRGTLSLGHVVGRTPQLAERPGFQPDTRGNYRPAYPLPSALAAAGTAAILSGIGIVELDGLLVPSLVAKLTASLLTAICVGWAFAAARHYTSAQRATVLALAFALGTNLWAAVSQTLWQQETALCALMAAIALLCAPQRSVGSLLMIGALLGLAGWARPQLTPTVIVACAWIATREGVRSAIALIPVLTVAGTAMSINLAWFNHPLGAVPVLEGLHPSVHGVSGSLERRPWIAALGLLVSPSRGLLVFSPIVLVAAFGLRRAFAEGRKSELTWCAIAAFIQLASYSLYAVWWGGHTFGPRYAIDILPPLVPLAAVGINTVMRSKALRLSAAVALAWSVVLQALGAFVYPAEQWNLVPRDVDTSHERLWDWRDSQVSRIMTTAEWDSRNYSLFSREEYR